MSGSLAKRFIELQGILNEYEYLIITIAYFAAPAIDGKKPSSLVAFTKDRCNLYNSWQKYGERACRQLNISFYETLNTENHITVLFYKPMELEAYINTERNMGFLQGYGYKKETALLNNLEHLKSRFIEGCPHEIGIFLGIPLDDVTGFIENKGKHFLMSGYWKVYKNPERARLYFELYDKARENIFGSMVEVYEKHE